MDIPQDKPSQTGPESAAEDFILKFNIRYIFFPKKRLIGKPQHATTESSQVKRENLLNIQQSNIWQCLIHIHCWQMQDDALLKSRGTTVDIGFPQEKRSQTGP